MRILGISAFYHDSAAALVRDGEIVSAAQEERFTRKKHDSRFPSNAVEYCLSQEGVGLSDVDFVAFYDKPFLKFERLLETYVAFAPRGLRSFAMAMPLWVREKLFQKNLLHNELKQFSKEFDWEHRLLFAEHHQSHAASAFYPSPFEDALILTMDGVGEWATTSVALGSGNKLEIIKEIHFPHSLGLLYSAFTYYTGFKVNSGEYKVMGLAPYGSPRFARQILDHLIDLKADGSFRLNLDYFNYCTGLTMTNSKFDSPIRRTATQARRTSHAKAHGSCRIGASRIGRSCFAHDAITRGRDRKEKPLSGWRSGAQLCGERTSAAGRSLRKNFGSSLRLVMPVELSVPRLPPITRSKANLANQTGAATT